MRRVAKKIAVKAKRAIGPKGRKTVKKELNTKYSVGHVAGAAGGGVATTAVAGKRKEKKALKKGRRQGLIVGAHLTKGSRKKVKKAYKKARKAGHKF